MGQLKFTNNATSTLVGDIASDATTLSVQTADASKFPSLTAGDWFPLTLVDAAGNREIVRVTARASAVLTITRAQEGTTARAFLAGARAELRPTAGLLTAIYMMQDHPDLPGMLTNIGLEQVDNTPDIDKPISNDQQAAFTAVGAEIDAIEANIDTIEADLVTLNASLLARLPIGTPLSWPMPKPPTGYLKRNGATLTRADYAGLWAVMHEEATVTMTIASPGVVTWNNHGRVAGDKVRFYTTGLLPTGIVANTTYYVIATGLTTNTFQVSATLGGAAINTTGSQSGVHTIHYAPWGFGDGSTTFTLMDDRGISDRFYDDGRGVDASSVFGVEQLDEYKSHTHGAAFTGDPHSQHRHPYKAGDNGSSSGPHIGGGGYQGNENTVNTEYVTTSTPTGTVAVTASGGDETRVRNNTKLPIIRAY